MFIVNILPFDLTTEFQISINALFCGKKNLVDYFAKGCGCFSCIFLFALGVTSMMQVVKYNETVGFTIGYTFINIKCS